MKDITEIEIRPGVLVEVLSMAVLYCRREIDVLANDVNAVSNDLEEYRRIIRIMDMALDILESVGDFPCTRLVKISASDKKNEELEI